MRFMPALLCFELLFGAFLKPPPVPVGADLAVCSSAVLYQHHITIRTVSVARQPTDGGCVVQRGCGLIQPWCVRNDKITPGLFRITQKLRAWIKVTFEN